MRSPLAPSLLLVVLLAACGGAEPPASAPSPVAAPAPPTAPTAEPPAPSPTTTSRYPAAPRGDTVDDYHGIKVPDPYRWLEDMDSAQTRAWITAENAITDAFFANVPGKASLRARIAELSNADQYGLPRRRGGRYFWAHNTGDQEQWVLYTARTLDETPKVLLDPNVISPDGSLAWAGWDVSRDGKTLAYELSAAGGDWKKVRLRDVATGKDLPDELEGLKYYKPAFSRDGKGLYYSRFPTPPAGKELTEPDHDCTVYFHAIGTGASQDKIVYARKDQPSWQFRPSPTRDGRWLVLEIGDGEVGDRGEEQIVAIDLSKPLAPPVAIVDHFEADYVYLGAEGSRLYLRTTKDAPKKRVVSYDLAARTPASAWKEVVPEGPNPIDDASLAGHKLIVTSLADAHTAAAMYELSGKKLRDVALPGIGTAYGFGAEPEDTETFFGFTSFTTPSSVLRLDLATGAVTPWKSVTVPLDPASLETTLVFYPGKDGTKIPMFLTRKKGAPRDGASPTLLYAYGGFGLSSTPFFWPGMAAWVGAGGTFAVAGIRGGGEYGEGWHKVAIKAKKQVSYDDLAAAGEWLVSSGITSRAHLGVFGISNGGLNAGVMVTERPDLFGAVAAIAGPHDHVRFPLFGEGAGWESDFGSPDVPEELRAMLAVSPLHNVRPGAHYPPTLIVTADHDVRVAPLHSYKFAAAMQWGQAGDAPVLLRVETTSGHGGGTRRSAQIDQESELVAFFAKTLGLPAHE
jgi:prolyl oligopeptidase